MLGEAEGAEVMDALNHGGNLIRYHPDNCTGSYLLNLSVQLERCVAGRLVAQWVHEVAAARCNPELDHRCFRDTSVDGKDAQPALIGRHYATERDSAPVQYNAIV